MNISIWWKWMRGLPPSKKWFIWLILLRPIIDNFYELKETSALASPLYIVGILTPILVLLSFATVSFPDRINAIEDIPFRIWTIFLTFNVLTYWFINLSVVSFGDMVKYATPAFLFFYSRRFVQSRDDMHGILTSFLVSSIFPIGVLLYESIVNPIAIEYISMGRGGGSRIRGAYADVMNYAIYLILFMLIMGYYFLMNLYHEISRIRIRTWILLAAIALVVYGLMLIRHVSTWAVFLSMVILFIMHNLRNSRGVIFALAFTMVVGAFFAEDIYVNNIEPLIRKELLVVEGETESNQAFNGRMTRWEKYFETWEQMPAINHFTGIVTANFKETVVMIGGGMHSDYVRLLFLTGFIGVGFYVIFYLGVLRKWFSLPMPEKFLLSSTVALMLLWSVTTVPTLYAPLLYIVFPILSYALLPRERLYS